MTRLRCLSLMLCALSLAGAAAAAEISPACKPVLDAELRVTTTPHHTVSTESGRKTVGEAITADGVDYIKIRDKWMKSPLTPQDNVERQRQNIKDATSYTCTRLPDDSVDGVPAFVYKVHSETPDVGSADAQIWLSKATGLPLRTEEDLDTGVKRHISIKYDYANIKAPR